MDLLAGIEGTVLAQGLRGARWGYAAVNGVHVLGIALLIGATVPLNLRLLGLWPSIARENVVRLLVPVAAAGLFLAVTAGLLLFSVRAREYADLSVVQIKLLLVTAGTAQALFAHWRHGFRLESASRKTLATHAVLSLTCWLGAMTCGRLIAFVAN